MLNSPAPSDSFHRVARHFADMEAVYSYEGTNEVNTLVVGREITGIQAFA